MSDTRIHPTAIVESGAALGTGVQIGAYAVIGADAKVGDNCRIGAHSVVTGNTEMGSECVVHPHAVVGGEPQDLKYHGEPTRLILGARNHIRENVTLNIGTESGGGVTTVGDDCILMACSHVAHDCTVGNRVILANNVMLAGHVQVQDFAILNGGVGIHHFTTVGRFAYVGGLSRITKDIPPFTIVEGHPSRVRGINVIGLKRGGLSDAAIRALKDAYRVLYRSDRTMADALKGLAAEFAEVPEVIELVSFLRASGGGRQGRQGEDPNRGHA